MDGYIMEPSGYRFLKKIGNPLHYLLSQLLGVGDIGGAYVAELQGILQVYFRCRDLVFADYSVFEGTQNLPLLFQRSTVREFYYGLQHGNYHRISFLREYP